MLARTCVPLYSTQAAYAGVMELDAMELLEAIGDWLINQWAGMLAGAAVTLCFMVIGRVARSVKERRRCPQPRVGVSEDGTGCVVVEIHGGGSGRAAITNLHTKFDIPGCSDSPKVEVECRGVRSADVSSSLLTWHHGVRTSETVLLHLSEVLPDGWCRITIPYKPTVIGMDSGVPFLDLHTISRINK